MTKTDVIEILLVEDNSSDAELTLHAFKRSKLANEVRVVRDGEEALNFLFCRANYSARDFKQPPSLILLDLKLPKVNGLQVLEAIKSDPRTKSIPVIVLTASNEELDLVKCYRFGVNSYIQKPVDFSSFQDVVRQLGMYWLLVNCKPPTAAYTTA